MATLTRKIATVELVDERVLTVRIINPDVLRCEEFSRLQGWAGMTVKDEVASLGDVRLHNTFQTWAALKRTGQYSSGFEQFRDVDCIDLSVDEEEVPPTQPAPASGYSPSSHGSDADPSTSSPEPTTS